MYCSKLQLRALAWNDWSPFGFSLKTKADHVYGVISAIPVINVYILSNSSYFVQGFHPIICFYSCIHLIEKTLSLEKYKPLTMGPNGFMGRTLLALQF